MLGIAGIYGTTGYRLIEGWSWFESLYMTVITLTTVGFGEVRPLSETGRLFTISLILFGIVTLAATVGALADVLVSGELGRSLRRRRRNRMIDQLKDHYIICAYGRVGRTAAQEFREQNAPCMTIEIREDLVPLMEEHGIPYLLGDPTEESVLMQAGIDRALGLVCAVDSDAVNVYITLTARAINPRLSIVARASNPESVDKLLRAGADRVVSPYSLSGKRMAFLALRPSVVDFVDMVTVAPDLRIEEIIVGPGSSLDGQTVARATSSQRGVTILAVKKGQGDLIASPPQDTVLEAADLVIALGPVTALNGMASACQVS